LDYKLLVVDIDGTLFITADAISKEDRAALAEVKRQGIRVALCSARPIQACRKIISELELDGCHVFFDGALVSDPHTCEEIYIRTISRSLVGEAVEFAHRGNIMFDLFSATGYFTESESWVTDIRRDYFGILPIIIDFARLPEDEKMIKGTLVVRSQEEKAAADRFGHHFESRLTLSMSKTPAYPDIDFINVIAPGVSKKGALDALVRHLGISLDQVMAIGDGVNDVPVLSSVGLAVAMGNAPTEVKAVADYVTLDANHSGVAQAIRKFLFVERGKRIWHR
jgi:Cof subfamily protein (haloacid dehalogenase superfamily)